MTRKVSTRGQPAPSDSWRYSPPALRSVSPVSTSPPGHRKTVSRPPRVSRTLTRILSEETQPSPARAASNNSVSAVGRNSTTGQSKQSRKVLSDHWYSAKPGTEKRSRSPGQMTVSRPRSITVLRSIVSRKVSRCVRPQASVAVTQYAPSFHAVSVVSVEPSLQTTLAKVPGTLN